jgi:hypothetical protein
MDRFVLEKSFSMIPICKESFHLIGVVAIFIASKYEDTNCISMEKLLRKVCHNKFSKEDRKRYSVNLEFQDSIKHNSGRRNNDFYVLNNVLFLELNRITLYFWNLRYLIA